MTIKFSTRVMYVFLCASLILLGTWIPFPANNTLAAGCYGSSCTGLNPHTLGCDNDAKTGPSKTVSENGGQNKAKVENRYSVVCNAEWERTRNKSSGSRYAAGSIRYGCANYCYHQSVSSPGPISYNQVVYTPMIGPDTYTDTRSCGRVATSGPIPIPLSNFRCTLAG